MAKQRVDFAEHLLRVLIEQEDYPLEDSLDPCRQAILLQQFLKQKLCLSDLLLFLRHGREGLQESLVDALRGLSDSL